MIEFAHFTIMAAVRRAWDANVTTTLTTWLEAHAGTAIEPIIRELHARFVVQGDSVSFVDYWNPIHWTTQTHLYSFGLEEHSPISHIVGMDHAMPLDDNPDHFATQQTGTVSVHCMSAHPFVPSFLARFARMAVMQERDWLIASGVDQVLHVATRGMVMPVEYLAEGMPMVYGTRVEFSYALVETQGRLRGARVGERKPNVVADEPSPIFQVWSPSTNALVPAQPPTLGEVRRVKFNKPSW